MFYNSYEFSCVCYCDWHQAITYFRNLFAVLSGAPFVDSFSCRSDSLDIVRPQKTKESRRTG